MALTLIPRTYEALARPLLFALPPETAQRAADTALKLWPLWRSLNAVMGDSPPELASNLAGLSLKNPIGLAAGYDKNCETLPGLSSLGFGYVTCGTVTRYPRPGNPAPRLLRDPSRRALLNSLGFPGNGLESAVENISRDRPKVADTPIVVSVSGTETDDIVACHRNLEPLSDAIEVNISSPNTANLRAFHEPDNLAELLDALNEDRRKPLFVKLPPFPDSESDPARHELAMTLADVCVSRRVEALTVSNTQPVQDSRLAVGSGGLSGAPIFGETIRMVSETRRRIGDSARINACGGISSAWEAWQALAAGADTVQLLTALVYRGPGVARDITAGLARYIRAQSNAAVRP